MMELAPRKKVPQDRCLTLNYTVGDAFCRDRYLSPKVSELYKIGILRLGHLVRLSGQELVELVPLSLKSQERVKRCLGEFGLELAMDVSETPFLETLKFLPRLSAPTPH